MNKKHMYGTVKDEPANEDLFKIGNYVEGLSNFIVTCETPMTIAIQGDWGSGKTSIMKQIESRLGSNVKSIFFNTWLYSQFDFDEILTISILSEFVEFLTSNLGENQKVKKEKMAKILLGLSNFAVRLVSTFVNNATNGVVNVEGVTLDDNRDLVNLNTEMDLLKNLNNEFQELVKQVKKDQKIDRIVFFIDDLDRLRPSRAVEVLEILKLFLESKDCVFVLAVDYNVILKGVRAKYGSDFEEDKGDAFFEKIIQVPFNVPIHSYDMENYISELLKDMYIFSKSSSYTLNQIKKLILSSIGKQPRNIKRLFNSYSLLLRIQSPKPQNEKELLYILAVLCLQQSYKDIFDFLSASDDFGDLEERFESIGENSEVFAQGELDKPEGFDNFISKFTDIYTDDGSINYDSLESSIKMSGLFSSSKEFMGKTVDYKKFWSGFSEYLMNQTELKNFKHSGNEVTSRYYRVKNSNSDDMHCEFRVNKNAIGFVYGSVKDRNMNTIIKNNLEKLSKEFSECSVSIREWKENESKNTNYNNIPGATLTYSGLGLGITEDYNKIYKWYVDNLKKISEQEYLQKEIK
ncbi:KAP family P-loop NTPase fold protein [Streptococcus suis]|nr:hypothetical protein [Streptococcus suis]